jgi:holliday junction DNA helicase RuvA
MIGSLSGTVLGCFDNQIIISTASGVGYLVRVSSQKIYSIQDTANLFIYHSQKEDAVNLYGFEILEDREWVEKLLRVSGVGPKMASLIIHTLGFEEVAQAIFESNAAKLQTVKGLGGKTAKKIVLELKGATIDLDEIQSKEKGGKLTKDMQQFIDTLVNLGYSKNQAQNLLSTLKNEGQWQDGDVAQMIKHGLKHVSR